MTVKYIQVTKLNYNFILFFNWALNKTLYIVVSLKLSGGRVGESLIYIVHPRVSI